MSNTACDTYQSPLATRYASPEMLQLFSYRHRSLTWRRLWVALARAQCKAGLPVSHEQVLALSENIGNINFDAIADYESKLHHDVMAHIHAYGDVAPAARGIIHLGATSCYVTDNGDLIIMREALQLLQNTLTAIVHKLLNLATKYAALPCLAYTHYQAALPTTIGKRFAGYAQDLLDDLLEVRSRIENLPFLGCRGATGTSAGMLALVNGDASKVAAIEQELAIEFQFANTAQISGQTYSRKIDDRILCSLRAIAISSHKFATDLRLLAHDREMEEGFASSQVGSSAMPHKRNPMLSERACGLARFIISLSENSAYTAATQWLERSLDDSVNRRLSLSESFLATDSLLRVLTKILDGLVVNESVIASRLEKELPFLITEEILMAAVKNGGDRQLVHENLRTHSQDASEAVKRGMDNPLLQLLSTDRSLGLSIERLAQMADATKLTGLAAKQVQQFTNYAKTKL